MPIAYYTSEAHFSHNTDADHPEHAMRIMAIEQALKQTGFWNELEHHEGKKADLTDIKRAHSEGYIEQLHLIQPDHGQILVDEDTAMTPGSLEAALWSAGACALALDNTSSSTGQHAFVATRPPGHHAEHRKAMGFCFFNNIAITALRAADVHHYQRIAILDFDAHQGNGTIDILGNDKRFLLCSSFQHPFYPYSHYEQAKFNNVINVPLCEGTGSATFRALIEEHWLPKLKAYAPEIILVSAGFDAHKDDPMAELSLIEDDYLWLGRQVRELASKRNTPSISILEGGYNLNALGASVAAYLRGLSD
ncbi:histone deacetylase family protein [Thalassolituus sp.]|uniref:histone deacetylase family protein n=1 Tax=Thalassolituus sp. TaxID=2030822 RepID=UPI003516F1DC